MVLTDKQIAHARDLNRGIAEGGRERAATRGLSKGRRRAQV
jgi:hypothetical protein